MRNYVVLHDGRRAFPIFAILGFLQLNHDQCLPCFDRLQAPDLPAPPGKAFAATGQDNFCRFLLRLQDPKAGDITATLPVRDLPAGNVDQAIILMRCPIRFPAFQRIALIVLGRDPRLR
jgi:hypothetical protein